MIRMNAQNNQVWRVLAWLLRAVSIYALLPCIDIVAADLLTALTDHAASSDISSGISLKIEDEPPHPIWSQRSVGLHVRHMGPSGRAAAAAALAAIIASLMFVCLKRLSSTADRLKGAYTAPAEGSDGLNVAGGAAAPGPDGAAGEPGMGDNEGAGNATSDPTAPGNAPDLNLNDASDQNKEAVEGQKEEAAGQSSGAAARPDDPRAPEQERGSTPHGAAHQQYTSDRSDVGSRGGDAEVKEAGSDAQGAAGGKGVLSDQESSLRKGAVVLKAFTNLSMMWAATHPEAVGSKEEAEALVASSSTVVQSLDGILHGNQSEAQNTEATSSAVFGVLEMWERAASEASGATDSAAAHGEGNSEDSITGKGSDKNDIGSSKQGADAAAERDVARADGDNTGGGDGGQGGGGSVVASDQIEG